MYFQVYIIAAFCAFSCFCTYGSKLDTLVERVRRLEVRLAEDISLLRQEMYVEFKDIQQTITPDDKTQTALNYLNSTFNYRLLDELEAFKSDIYPKFQYLQKGFHQEKRVVRSLHDSLEKTVQSVSERTDVFKQFLQNLSAETIDSFKPVGQDLSEKLTTVQEILKSITTLTPQSNMEQKGFKDCSDLLRHGHVSSGIYTIHPDTIWRPLQVYCDMTTAGGGWTVFQRRKDGTENFQRLWLEYAFGFGSLDGEFWLGNEFIHRLTSSAPHEMRIELEDFENDRRVAEYGLFSISASSDLYKLSVQYFTGNVSDSLTGTHNGRQFSTKDNGPSSSCANSYKGGFWYNNCHAVNINGQYLKGQHESYADGINWYGWKGHHYSLKMTEMKFRSK